MGLVRGLLAFEELWEMAQSELRGCGLVAWDAGWGYTYTFRPGSLAWPL